MLNSERGTSEPDEEVEEMVEPPSAGAPVGLDVRARSVAIGMACLDEFHVPDIFKERSRVMRTVPLLLKGAFRGGALRVAFEEAQCARDNNDDGRNCRAWKFVHVAPKNASQQATSRRSSPQEVVGGTIPDVQCWPVGGIGQN